MTQEEHIAQQAGPCYAGCFGRCLCCSGLAHRLDTEV